MIDFESFYRQFSSQLEEARRTKNHQQFQKLLHVVEPDWKKPEQALYVDYCLTKAGVFALFGDNLDMDDWMMKALQFCQEEERTSLFMKWMQFYWLQSGAIDNQSIIQANFSALFNVASQALDFEKEVYNRYAFLSVRFFVLAALGKHGELEAEMKQVKFEDVPAKLMQNPNKLQHFYTHIYKMIIAALEIRSEALVFKILQMISIDDMLMASKAPLFRKFNTVIMDTVDMRPEFAADFNFFYQMRKKWAGFLPNFSLFTMMIEEENIKGLDFFFKGFDS